MKPLLIVTLLLAGPAFAQMTAPPADSALDAANAAINDMAEKVVVPAILLVSLFGIFAVTKLGQRMLGIASGDGGYSSMHHNGRVIGHIRNSDR